MSRLAARPRFVAQPRLFAIIAALLLASSGFLSAYAQSSISGRFERNINQYRWNSDLVVRERNPEWILNFGNHFQSDAFILFDNRLRFRDENRFSLALRRPLKSTELVFYSQAGWYSLSKVITTSSYAGLRLGNSDRFWVEPLVGVSLDRRPGISDVVATRSTSGAGPSVGSGAGGIDITPDPLRTDAGPAIGFNAKLQRSDFDGYEIQVEGRGRYESLSPRQSNLVRIFGTVSKSYSQLSTRTSFSVASVRRDAYQAASFLNRSDDLRQIAQSIESTRSDTLDLSLDLNETISPVLSVGGRLAAALNRRNVRILSAPESATVFDTEFERNDLSAEVNGAYSKGEWFLRFSLSAGAQVESRRLVNQEDLPIAQAAQKALLLRQAEFDRGVIEGRLLSRAPLGGRTKLQLDISANIVRHDTPVVNPDDRDELFYRGQIGSSTRLTDELELQLQVFGTYFHTVYLKSLRSAENSVQRSLRFRPTVRWRPTRKTRIELISQVRATFTVDDFILPGRRPLDQSARELRYDFDAERGIGESTVLKLTGRLSDLRLGRFLNKTFSEIPFDSLRTTNLWGRIEIGERLKAELGFRTFVRSDFDRALNVKYDVRELVDDPSVPGSMMSVLRTRSITRQGRRTISQNGPTASITWNLRHASYVRFQGWAIVQRITYRLYGELPAETAATIRRAASRGNRTLIPNMSLAMFWRF